MQAPNPFLAGVRGRCPRCGQGRLFNGYLKLAHQCEACGLDYRKADPGDGPAVLIMFVVGFLVIPLVLVVEVTASPPIWLHMLIWTPLALGLCVALLRPFKATFFALQFTYDAGEGQLEAGQAIRDRDDDGAR